MTESKFADFEDENEELERANEYESKFMDVHEGEGKFADELDEGSSSLVRESKQGEENEEMQIVVVQGNSIFGDAIVSRLVDFWGVALSEDIETFFARHCHKFDDGEEHKLFYTDLHAEYEKIVEGHLHEFRKQEGLSVEELNKQLREATENNELAELVINLVLCCADFNCFVDIMKAKRLEMEFDENYGKQTKARDAGYDETMREEKC